MGAREELERFAAGGAAPADLSMAHGTHVLGMTGSATWTIVMGDGLLKMRRSRMGSDDDVQDLGRAPVQAVRALAKVLAARKVDAIRATPGAVTDMHSAMNLKTTIDVTAAGAKVHVDLPTEEAEARDDTKAIEAAFVDARTAATTAPAAAAPPAATARPATPVASATAASTATYKPPMSKGLLAVVTCLGIQMCLCPAFILFQKNKRENNMKELEERFAREAKEKADKLGAFNERLSDWATLDPTGEGGEPSIKGNLVLVEHRRTNAVDELHLSLADALRAKSVADVGTVVRLRRDDDAVGKYSSGSTGYVRVTHVTLFDPATKKLIAERTFRGGNPPSSKRDKGDAYGSSPDTEVLAWLTSLPRT